MRGTEYPLQTLLRLRGEICKERELALGDATRVLEAADGALARARERHRDQRTLVTSQKQRVFEGGAGTVGHHMRQQRYVQRLEREAGLLAAAVTDAERRREVAAAERELARAALAKAEAERRVVENNKAAWTEARQREAAARAEAELDDLVAARRRG